jgi:hypothetical protein
MFVRVAINGRCCIGGSCIFICGTRTSPSSPLVLFLFLLLLVIIFNVFVQHQEHPRMHFCVLCNLVHYSVVRIIGCTSETKRATDRPTLQTTKSCITVSAIGTAASAAEAGGAASGVNNEPTYCHCNMALWPLAEHSAAQYAN